MKNFDNHAVRIHVHPEFIVCMTLSILLTGPVAILLPKSARLNPSYEIKNNLVTRICVNPMIRISINPVIRMSINPVIVMYIIPVVRMRIDPAIGMRIDGALRMCIDPAIRMCISHFQNAH